MAKADSVHSTPPTNTPVRIARIQQKAKVFCCLDEKNQALAIAMIRKLAEQGARS